MGYKISHNSIEIDEKKVKAIRDFLTPTTITDLRSFMGLVNQLGGFSAEVASAANPLRGLLKAKNQFKWLPDHSKAFENTKKALTSPPVLAMFDKNAQTCLQTDASKTNGLRFALLQRQDDSQSWQLIQCGSRFLSDTETRYVTLELEALAIFWAIKKCDIFLAGLPHFLVITDHKPLIPLFNQFALGAIENPRVQNYRIKLLNYTFTVERAKEKITCNTRCPFPCSCQRSRGFYRR